jgi:ABC-type uncharacterized transport system substrate-binding protein
MSCRVSRDHSFVISLNDLGRHPVLCFRLDNVGKTALYSGSFGKTLVEWRPTIYDRREFVLAGGRMSYGTHYADAFRQIGVYAGKILRRGGREDRKIEQEAANGSRIDGARYSNAQWSEMACADGASDD